MNTFQSRKTKKRTLASLLVFLIIFTALLFGFPGTSQAIAPLFTSFGGHIIWVWPPFTYPAPPPIAFCPAWIVIVGPPRPMIVAVYPGTTLMYAFWQYLVPGPGPKPPESPLGPSVKGNVWLPVIDPLTPAICAGALRAIQIGSSLL